MSQGLFAVLLALCGLAVAELLPPVPDVPVMTTTTTTTDR
jgi:hypothetical protein